MNVLDTRRSFNSALLIPVPAHAAFDDLMTIATPERQACVQMQIDLLRAGVREAISNPDREY